MRQSNKPRIKIPLTTLDWSMEFLSFAALMFIWCYVIFSYKHLPISIPMHFNAFGSIDSYGNKSSIFMLPFVVSFLYLLLTIVSQYPSAHHYAVKVTEENARAIYSASARLVRYLKSFILVVFCVLLIQIINPAHQETPSLSPLFLPILIFGLIVPTVFFMVKSLKYKA